ncbi:MAG TPA: acyltransferase family protein, partial [Bryobacteraceae bacterium]
MNRPKIHDRVFGLDLLRAAAIGLVLLGHVLLMMRMCFRSLTGWSVMAGYFGVELFFVLSGFLIGGILIRDFSKSETTGALGRFWGRRWLRTLPLFYLFLVINLVIDTSLGQPTTGWWRNAFFVQNFASAAGPFFVESWSLAVEEWFYLLAPVLIFIVLKCGVPLK